MFKILVEFLNSRGWVVTSNYATGQKHFLDQNWMTAESSKVQNFKNPELSKFKVCLHCVNHFKFKWPNVFIQTVYE